MDPSASVAMTNRMPIANMPAAAGVLPTGAPTAGAGSAPGHPR